MESTDTRSPGSPGSRMALLQAELEEKEQKLIQAAMYGKTLLEENADLSARMDTLMKQHAAVLEDKQQELCNLNSRLEIAASTEKWQQEEIANLRAEVQSVRDQANEEKKQETAVYKKQVESLHLDVDHLQAVERDLRGEVAQLEALLQTHLDRTLTHSFSSGAGASLSTCEEIASLAEELSSLKIDLTEAQAKAIEVSGQLQECQREKDTLAGRLKCAGQEMEDLQCQALSYSRHLEESRREVQELRAQLDASRVDGQVHSSKGNSIFSELEDRRLVLEKRAASLRIQNEQLKEKYSLEKQQNSKYKMQIAMALQMTNQKEDPTAKRLRGELSEAHAEIRTLIDKVQQLEASKDDLVSSVGNGGDQFFMATLQIEKNKAAKAEGELQAKTLQYLDVSQQNVQLTHNNRQLEAERDRLRAQLLKVIAQKEELIAKYEPDKVKESKAQKKVVEKIDLGDPLFQMQDMTFTSSGRPSDIFKPCPPTGRASNVFKTSRASTGFSNPPIITGRPSDAFKVTTMSGRVSDVLKPLNAIEETGRVSDLSAPKEGQTAPTQKENFTDAGSDSSFHLPAGRSVKMADDVKVIYADGERSVEALSEEREQRVPAETKKKQKAARNVKYIKADEAPQLDCKTQ